MVSSEAGGSATDVACRRVRVSAHDKHLADAGAVEALHDPLEMAATADHTRREVRHHTIPPGREHGAEVERAVQSQLG